MNNLLKGNHIDRHDGQIGENDHIEADGPCFDVRFDEAHGLGDLLRVADGLDPCVKKGGG
ncbi:hypothetical protein D3C87_1439370 [compost metagenome]